MRFDKKGNTLIYDGEGNLIIHHNTERCILIGEELSRYFESQGDGHFKNFYAQAIPTAFLARCMVLWVCFKYIFCKGGTMK